MLKEAPNFKSVFTENHKIEITVLLLSKSWLNFLEFEPIKYFLSKTLHNIPDLFESVSHFKLTQFIALIASIFNLSILQI